MIIIIKPWVMKLINKIFLIMTLEDSRSYPKDRDRFKKLLTKWKENLIDYKQT